MTGSDSYFAYPARALAVPTEGPGGRSPFVYVARNNYAMTGTFESSRIAQYWRTPPPGGSPEQGPVSVTRCCFGEGTSSPLTAMVVTSMCAISYPEYDELWAMLYNHRYIFGPPMLIRVQFNTTFPYGIRNSVGSMPPGETPTDLQYIDTSQNLGWSTKARYGDCASIMTTDPNFPIHTFFAGGEPFFGGSRLSYGLVVEVTGVTSMGEGGGQPSLDVNNLKLEDLAFESNLGLVNDLRVVDIDFQGLETTTTQILRWPDNVNATYMYFLRYPVYRWNDSCEGLHLANRLLRYSNLKEDIPFVFSSNVPGTNLRLDYVAGGWNGNYSGCVSKMGFSANGRKLYFGMRYGDADARNGLYYLDLDEIESNMNGTDPIAMLMEMNPRQLPNVNLPPGYAIDVVYSTSNPNFLIALASGKATCLFSDAFHPQASPTPAAGVNPNCQDSDLVFGDFVCTHDCWRNARPKVIVYDLLAQVTVQSLELSNLNGREGIDAEDAIYDSELIDRSTPEEPYKYELFVMYPWHFVSVDITLPKLQVTQPNPQTPLSAGATGQVYPGGEFAVEWTANAFSRSALLSLDQRDASKRVFAREEFNVSIDTSPGVSAFGSPRTLKWFVNESASDIPALNGGNMDFTIALSDYAPTLQTGYQAYLQVQPTVPTEAFTITASEPEPGLIQITYTNDFVSIVNAKIEVYVEKGQAYVPQVLAASTTLLMAPAPDGVSLTYSFSSPTAAALAYVQFTNARGSTIAVSERFSVGPPAPNATSTPTPLPTPLPTPVATPVPDAEADAVVVEAVDYDPAVVADAAALVQRISAAYKVAPVVLKDGPADGAAQASDTPEPRTTRNVAELQYTFAGSLPASQRTTFALLLQTLGLNDPTRASLLAGVYLSASGGKTYANVAFVFLGLPLGRTVTGTFVFDPDLSTFASIADLIFASTGYRPASQSTTVARRSALQYSRNTASAAFGTTTGALLAAQRVSTSVPLGDLAAVYSFALTGGETVVNPFLSYSSAQALPFGGIGLAPGSSLLELPIGSDQIAFVASSGAAQSVGTAITKSPATEYGLATAGADGADALLRGGVLLSETGTVTCAASDGTFAYAAVDPDASFSFVRFTPGDSGDVGRQFITQDALPSPSSCVYLGSTTTGEGAPLIVGSRRPAIYRVFSSEAGLSASPVELGSSSTKPVVLGAATAPAKASKAVFLQSDDATSVQGGTCNADGAVFLHLVERGGKVTSLEGSLREECPRALAVSPDESAVFVLSTSGSVFRASLKSSGNAGFRRVFAAGGAPLAAGEAIASIAFLTSRAYLVVATLGNQASPSTAVCGASRSADF
eukprot:tig00000411_g564.t1